MRRFRPPAWAWLLTAVSLVLFATLGIWQWQRGLGKQQWLAQFQDGAAPNASVGDRNSSSTTPAATSALTLSTHTPAAQELAVQRAQATGVYLADRQLLQDGQSREGQPGFHVWTPLRLADGALLLVNRGWIPQPADLTALPSLPAPESEVTTTGWWRSLPQPGVRVGGNDCRKPQSFPAVVVYPPLEQLQCLLGEAVLPGLLLLDARESGGFVREWTVTGFPPERHYGYAVTWFGLGVTALVLFVILNLKRNDQT